MSRFNRRIIVVVLLAVLCAFLPTPVSTAQAATNPLTKLSLPSLRARMLYLHQTGRTTELELTLKQVKSRSTFEAKLWRTFLRSWNGALTTQRFSYAAPRSLPTRRHAFVVLGSGNATELKKRTTLAATAHAAHLNSVAVLSGGKATDTRPTEAEQMRLQLVAAGIDSARLLLEPRSASTVSNAWYSVALMKARGITSYTLISDASHLRRAGVLFHAAVLRDQYQSRRTLVLTQLGNVAVRDKTVTNPASTATSSYITSNVASVLGVYDRYSSLLSKPPARAKLVGFSAHPTRKKWAVGSTFDRKRLSATARFDQGKLGVATAVKVRGFNSKKTGTRRITVTYRYRSVTKKAHFTITVVRAKGKVLAKRSAATAIRNRTRIVLDAQVYTSTRVRPTGTVQLYLNGKRIKTLTLTKADRGRVRYRLPKLTRLGKARLKIVYLGNSKVTPVTRTVTVRVVRA